MEGRKIRQIRAIRVPFQNLRERPFLILASVNVVYLVVCLLLALLIRKELLLCPQK